MTGCRVCTALLSPSDLHIMYAESPTSDKLVSMVQHTHREVISICLILSLHSMNICRVEAIHAKHLGSNTSTEVMAQFPVLVFAISHQHVYTQVCAMPDRPSANSKGTCTISLDHVRCNTLAVYKTSVTTLWVYLRWLTMPLKSL